MKKKTFSTECAGKKIEVIFSDLAEQATGSVIVKYGETAVLATAVMSAQEKEGDFFPLTVDFEERFYAAGKILGSQFVRREGKPSDTAILSGRIIDRTIRPLFNQAMRNEVQVVVTLLALDDGDPHIASVLAASLALSTSSIPWNGPVSAVRIGIDESSRTIVNPAHREKLNLSLDLLVCGKDDTVNMIESSAHEMGEEAIGAMLDIAIKEIRSLQSFQEKIIKEMGVEKRHVHIRETSEVLKKLFEKEMAPHIKTAVFSGPGNSALKALEEKWFATLQEHLPTESHVGASDVLESAINQVVHDEAIDHKKRADGRGLDEIRPLFAEAGGISLMLHGSGTFYRGGTHVLSVATLGGPEDSQTIDGLTGEEQKRYMHHYNFPPFSTGETGRSGSTNRRMIGHGALAEKALLPVLPSKDTFPYTIRVVSEAFASNGSTSMASVCGSSLALMDAGVPIHAHVAGIASGLMMRTKKGFLGKEKCEYVLLTDIQGPEDHHGDMDFKVAGTRRGITAIQLDIKVDGIPTNILKEAFEKAKGARHMILDVMEKAIASPRPSVSPYAPRIVSFGIQTDQIGLVIGTGGKTIKEIKEKTGADITIEDDGTVYVSGPEQSVRKARAVIEALTKTYKEGDRLTGEVTKITEFGAFVRIDNKTEGLVHISEFAPWRIESLKGLVSIGQQVPIVVKEVDERGRLSLSIKRADEHFFGDSPMAKKE